jgi:hypothetical protein
MHTYKPGKGGFSISWPPEEKETAMITRGLRNSIEEENN